MSWSQTLVPSKVGNLHQKIHHFEENHVLPIMFNDDVLPVKVNHAKQPCSNKRSICFSSLVTTGWQSCVLKICTNDGILRALSKSKAGFKWCFGISGWRTLCALWNMFEFNTRYRHEPWALNLIRRIFVKGIRDRFFSGPKKKLR